MTQNLTLHAHQFSIPSSYSSSSLMASHLFPRPIMATIPSSSLSSSSTRVQMGSLGTPQVQQITSPIRTRRREVKCMANPIRVAKVASQIRRVISEMLITDKHLQHAIQPEAALGADRYLSSVTTVSDVEVSSDLQVVKVYISVFGDDRGREVAISGLKSKAKYVRSQLGRYIRLRLTPEIRFIEDDSFERGSRVIAILDKIKSDNEKKAAKSQGKNEEATDQPDDEDDWEEDPDEEDWEEEDPDEGVIYVR